jgi:hypothetical protein
MVIVESMGCQANAGQVYGLQSKANRIKLQQKQQSVVGVNCYFLLKVLNALYSRMRNNAFPSQPQPLTQECQLNAALSLFCEHPDSGRGAENAFVRDFRLPPRYS